MTADVRDILHTPYELGGTIVGVGLDCYTATCAVARRRGLPPPDLVPSIREAALRGEIPTGFPAGWESVPVPFVLQDGDILLGYGVHPWSAIVHDGRVISASETAGCVYAVPLHRWRKPPSEVWRFRP